MPDAPRADRFAEFIRRLAAAPAVASFEKARGLIDATLNAVEDEMTSIPFDPSAWMTDGRMYPVQDDYIFDVSGRPDLKRLATRRQDLFIRSNGAFRIVSRRDAQILIEKLGSDGKGVDP